MSDLPRPTSLRPAAGRSRPARGRWLLVSAALHGALFAGLALRLRAEDRTPAPATTVTARAEALVELEPSPVVPPEPIDLPDRPRDDPIPWSELSADLHRRDALDCGFAQPDPEWPETPRDRLAALVREPWTIGLGGDVHSPRAWAHGSSGGQAAASPVPLRAAPPAPPPAAAVAPPGVTRGPSFAVEPEPPPYPEPARRRGWEGIVIVRVGVAATGAVESLEVVVSSGRRLLDECAVETARTWRFLPALRDGTRTAGTLDVPVRFRLD